MKIKKLDTQGFSHEIGLVVFAVFFGIAGVAFMVASHADPKTTGAINASLHVTTKSYCIMPDNKINEVFTWPQMNKTETSFKIQISNNNNWSANAPFTITSTGNPGNSPPPNIYYQSVSQGAVSDSGAVLSLTYPTTYYVRVYDVSSNEWTSGSDTFQPLNCVPPPPAPPKTTSVPATSNKPTAVSSTDTSTNSKASSTASSSNEGTASSSDTKTDNTASNSQPIKEQQKPLPKKQNLWAKVKNWFTSKF